MSLLAFRELEKKLEAIQREMDDIKNTDSYRIDAEFYQELIALMSTYDQSPQDVVALFNRGDAKQAAAPASEKRAKKAPTSRRHRRPARIYTNPHTGEVIKTRNPKNRELRLWMAKYGPDVVTGWGRIVTNG